MGLKSMLEALDGGAGDLGRPDVLKRVVDGILKLREHGTRGTEVLPPEVIVKIKVPEGSVEVVRRFVEEPAFDRDIDAGLRNQLLKVDEELPLRRYVVEPAVRKTGVEVTESHTRGVMRLRIEGGDRDGTEIPLPPQRRDLLLGRGPWHGDGQVSNDIVVVDDERAVSRRAARLHRVGAVFELESVDQRESLSVLRPDGQRLRPALSATGRVSVRRGDVIEFTDGARPVVLLRLLDDPA
jgi:hypothetical protein